MSDFTNNIAEVNAKLRSIAKNLTPNLVGKLQRKILLDVLAGVVRRTPVDEGRARGGWQVSVGQPAAGTGTPEPGGIHGSEAGKTFTAGAAVVAGIEPFTIAFVSNNIPYIGILDRGGFIPPHPADDSATRIRRRGRRNERQRRRAATFLGDEGATMVVAGYSFQAPSGMIALTLDDVRRSL